MSPQKQKFLPVLILIFLFLLLSLSSILLSSNPSSNPNPQNFAQLPKITSPNQNFTFIIKVLTFNRLSSLSRCLKSLSRAQYDINDKVHLHVFIDHFNENSGPDFEQELNVSREIVDFVDQFDWGFGEKLVHYRTSNAGLQAQWLEAWWPSSDHEFAFVVEDDLEVSPLYYRFLKSVIMNYYYNASNYSPSIYGASLQRPRFVPGKHGNKMQLDGESQIFLYQLVGTWGQLLFPRPWKEFRLWYDTQKAKGVKPLLDGMVTTGWYKKMGEKIWTPWFIKFIHSRGYFNIYTNFHHERALSVSHRDAGVNYGKTAGPDSYLLDEKNSNDFNLLEMCPLNDLKWYDFCFRQVRNNRIVRSFDELKLVLRSVEKKKTVVLVSLYGVQELVARNLLCHFEKLNIRNYIFVGPTSQLLLDLARRGHPVIDAGQFSEFSKLAKSVNFQDSTIELMKEILVEAYVTQKCLELGYNTWVLNGNSIPISNSSFVDYFERKNDVFIGKISKFLFVRRSSSSWGDDFVYKVASMVDTLRKESVSHDSILFYAVEKLLEDGGVKFNNVDEMHLGLDIGKVTANPISFLKEDKFIFWPSEKEFETVQRELLQLELWGLDADSSCAGVFCHSS